MTSKNNSTLALILLWGAVFAVLIVCGLLIRFATHEVRILFFGDLMLDRGVAKRIQARGVDHIFDYLHATHFTGSYDFVTANLEGAVTDSAQHYPPANLYDFAFDPATVGALKKYGFNMFSLANNHLADQGNRGVAETRKNLTELGFYHYGCPDGMMVSVNPVPVFGRIDAGTVPAQHGVTVNESSALIVKIKGYRVAFLSFSCVYTAIDSRRIVSMIKKLRAQSDFVIVSPHWGVEYQPQANRFQKKLAHAMIDAGADAVIGHHPHVIQNHEIYKGKPVYYSLGNFIFDQYFSENTQAGLAVSLRLSRDAIRHKSFLIRTGRSRIESIAERKSKHL